MCSQGRAAAACVPGAGSSTAPIVVTPLSQTPLDCLCTSSGHRQTLAARGLCVSPSACFRGSGLWSRVSLVHPQGTSESCHPSDACRFPCGPCVHSHGRIPGVECGADGSSVLSCLRSLTVFNSGLIVHLAGNKTEPQNHHGPNCRGAIRGRPDGLQARAWPTTHKRDERGHWSSSLHTLPRESCIK